MDMLCIVPSSLNLTGTALRFAVVDVPANISMTPMVSVVVTISISWVTVTVLLETPAPVIVTVPILGLGPVFAEFAATVIVLLFAPDAEETSSQL